ncbi:MAG TPA: DNA polymerase IV [Ignavibacteria bacterium]|nr:DNA polymerase IV [Ignavibacteria bacterium]
MQDKFKIIFHIDMDAFFASCEEALRPELKSKPLIVGGTKEDKRSIVACPNYLARAKGIRTAMPLSKAMLLAPDGNFIRSTRGLYSDYSKKVREIFFKYTPVVQPVSVDEAFLDVTEVMHLYNNDYRKLANSIKDEIKNTLKITCSIGIATNKICAKIGSKMNKPDGITEVPFGKEKEFLKDLTIDKIPGAGKATQERLRKYGIIHIGDLLKYDRSFYENEIGIHTSFLLNVASGTSSNTVKEFGEERKSLSKENTFWEDTSDREFLHSELYYLMERCCQKLRSISTKSRTITVKVKYYDFKVNQKSFTGKKYSNIETDFYEDAVELLDLMLANKKKIRLLGIKFSELVKGDDAMQENMFDDVDKKENLLKKLDKIRKKYNYDIVKFGRTVKLK